MVDANTSAAPKLLIFKVNQLGDNVVFLPTVQALTRAMPEAKITVVTSPVAEQLYRVTCPQVDTLTYETRAFNQSWRHPVELFKLCRTFRALRPDACLIADDQGNASYIMARASGARTIVGPLLEKRFTGFLIQHRVAISLHDSVAKQNWQIAKALLQDLKVNTASLPDSPPAPDLSSFGADTPCGILIHPGASRDYKRWPMDRYVALAKELVQSHPVVWITQNVPEEEALPPAVRREKPASLAAFISLMAGAQFFIGNNSGPMNIASALGLSGLIFNGPSTPNWDPPWHPERLLLLRDPALKCQPCDAFTHPVDTCQNSQQPMICMKRWSVEEVAQLTLDRLRSSPPKGS